MTIEPTRPARSEPPEAARRAAGEPSAAPERAAPEQAEAAPSRDVIELSAVARTLAAARAAAEAPTPERAALLDELKARIEAGTYEPDAEAIAREIVDSGEA